MPRVYGTVVHMLPTHPIPLSLYIHIPWCTKKCPYCDFNSHQVRSTIPEADYVRCLIEDLRADQSDIQGRPLQSIFFGGGTPSLFQATSIDQILRAVDRILPIQAQTEITLEANPGSAQRQRFKDYRSAGINRISLGAQSFQDEKLAALGRIHSAAEIEQAIDDIIQSGFTRFNIDLMYGLPHQTLEDACFDLQSALAFEPPHLSWYHLTIEPNTIFYQKKPPLPPEDTVCDLQDAGLAILAERGLQPYEVSAFARSNTERCVHNVNYWQFGDYLGIGAGAHAKITDLQYKTIKRCWKTRSPRDYLDRSKSPLAGTRLLQQNEIPLEFMLNALRLEEGISLEFFEARTFLKRSCIEAPLKRAVEAQLLGVNNQHIRPTELGKRFLNDLVANFME